MKSITQLLSQTDCILMKRGLIAVFLFLHLYSQAQTAQQLAIAEIERNMVSVPGGTFEMGCNPNTDFDCGAPSRLTVTLSPFFISKFEVTRKQWKAVMGEDPSWFRNHAALDTLLEKENPCMDCPVENISWQDAQAFMTKLNTLSGKKYRFPTEAEWEFAAKGGNKPAPEGLEMQEVAWYDCYDPSGDCEGNSEGKTHPVGKKKANALGLYDMQGNVGEWCSDWEYVFYPPSPQTNPKGPASGEWKIIRGGSWADPMNMCMPDYRSHDKPDSRLNVTGLRLAR